MKKLLFLVILMFPSIALALPTPITFNLRDPAIESIDEVLSFTLTEDGLMATLTANPSSFTDATGTHAVVLNQTSSSFGINVVGTTCGGLEDSATIDGGCTGESIRMVFSENVILNSLKVSSFGTTDKGLVTIGATTMDVLSTGTHLLGDVFLPAGQEWSLAWMAGNGFSFDNFTVTAVPEPATWILMGVGLVGLGLAARRRDNFWK